MIGRDSRVRQGRAATFIANFSPASAGLFWCAEHMIDSLTHAPQFPVAERGLESARGALPACADPLVEGPDHRPAAVVGDRLEP
jgi:hypothetical protein